MSIWAINLQAWCWILNFIPIDRRLRCTVGFHSISACRDASYSQFSDFIASSISLKDLLIYFIPSGCKFWSNHWLCHLYEHLHYRFSKKSRHGCIHCQYFDLFIIIAFEFEVFVHMHFQKFVSCLFPLILSSSVLAVVLRSFSLVDRNQSKQKACWQQMFWLPSFLLGLQIQELLSTDRDINDFRCHNNSLTKLRVRVPSGGASGLTETLSLFIWGPSQNCAAFEITAAFHSGSRLYIL